MSTLGKSPTLWRNCQRIISEFSSESIANTGVSECIEWDGYCHRINKYGQVKLKGKTYGAHVAVAKVFLEDYTPSLWVLHTCDNPPCINPLHLVMGTAKDNHDDQMSKGRWKGNEKITPEDIEDIKGFYSLGLYQYEIADMYGLSQAGISKILKRAND